MGLLAVVALVFFDRHFMTDMPLTIIELENTNRFHLTPERLYSGKAVCRFPFVVLFENGRNLFD